MSAKRRDPGAPDTDERGGDDGDDGIDRELAHLSPAARWREWLVRVEAVLFASAGPVPRARLARVVGEGAVLGDLVGDLRAELAGRPCEVVAVGEGWMLRTRPAYGAIVRAAADLPAAGPALREPDLAVLAAIATRQPVTRTELARLFGRRIGAEVLARLTARDLVAPGPRSPTPGAPQTLVTTDAFLATFGLRSVDEMEEGGE